MMRWYVRYLPYALVVWLCRRYSERFKVGHLTVANPFEGEIVGWDTEPNRAQEPR